MKWSTVGWVTAIAVVLGGSAYTWFWFAGGSGEPTTELTTPTLASSNTTDPPPDTTGTRGSASDTTQPPERNAEMVFVIDPERSSASFELGEVLRGTEQQVVGTTNQLAGQVQLDTSDLSKSVVSDVVVNARTLETGSGQRDRVIRGPVILDSSSDEFELVTFSEISIDGLEGTAEVGETLEFNLTGDLTIKGNTNQETFEATATLVDETTIQGSAQTTLSRSDYDIGIPSVPGLASVDEQVQLSVEFVAVATSG